MRRVALSLILTAASFGVTSSASAGGFDLRLGGFFPAGKDILFNDLKDLYTPSADPQRGVKGSDFNGVSGGMEFNSAITDFVELGLHGDYYGRTRHTSYRRYERPDGSEIRQELSLKIAPVGVTLRLVPTSKHRQVVPYIGGGIDAFFYSYEEAGDFIDFFDATLPIVADDFKATGTAFGGHVVGGVRLYLNRDFALVAEARRQFAKHDMTGDFAPNQSGLVNRIDLGGSSVVFGLHLRF